MAQLEAKEREVQNLEQKLAQAYLSLSPARSSKSRLRARLASRSDSSILHAKVQGLNAQIAHFQRELQTAGSNESTNGSEN